MTWLPLPKIARGIAVYPFSPASAQQALGQFSFPANSRPLTAYSTIQSPLFAQPTDAASILTANSGLTTHSESISPSSEPTSNNPADYACLIGLEVGDELFILEQNGQWYRGYVLSSLEEGRKPNIAPVGCFPASHVQIKEYLDLDTSEQAHHHAIASRRTDSLLDHRPFSPAVTPDFTGLSRSLSESHIELPTTKSYHYIPPSPRNLPISRPVSQVDMPFELDNDPNARQSRPSPPPSLLLARFDQSTITGSSEPLVDEIAACVSEWNCLLYRYLEERRYTMFNTVRDHINHMLQARRQLLDQALSKEELHRLRKDIIRRMALLNMTQHSDMIIRHPERGYVLDVNSVSLATLLRMHWKYALSERISLPTTVPSAPRPASVRPQSIGSGYDIMASQVPTSASAPMSPPRGKFYHLFFELKACVAHICQPGEFTELSFSLYNNAEGCFVTEQFVVVLTYNGMPKDERQIGKLHTLFTDLASHDVTEHLNLVCRIVRLGNIKYADKEKDHFGSIGSHASVIFGGEGRVKSYFDAAHHRRQQSSASSPVCTSNTLYRRPFGCAVLHIGSLLEKQDLSPTPDLTSTNMTTTSFTETQHVLSPMECDVRIFTATSEATFATLHQDIINNHTKYYAKSARAESLCIFLRMFHGQIDDVLKTNAALLQEVPRTLRLGFPDAVFPDDRRNELYVTLNSGDFTQFSRSRNIQVTLCARDNVTGDTIENALSSGSGSPRVTFWDSVVFYHEQRPKWEETIKVELPDQSQWTRTHLFFTVRHRSSHGAGSTGDSSAPSSPTPSANDRVVAFGFLPLFLPPQGHYFVADGVHTLSLFRCDRQFAHPRVYLQCIPWCQRSSAPFNMQNMDPSLRSRQNNDATSLKYSHSSFSIASQCNSNTVVSDTLPSKGDASKLTMARDTLTVKTFLCSTQFTQNETLALLLNWKAVLDAESATGAYDELLAILDKFPFVGELEVVKFLNDILDSLFGILAYPYEEETWQQRLCDEALGAMVWVLGIVQDRRFSNFRPVLDVYIEQRLSSTDDPLLTKHACQDGKAAEAMLKAMLRLCTHPSEPKKAKRLRSSMKVWEYLFRFIVRSYLLQQTQDHHGERNLRTQTFKQDLQQLLALINQIMSPEQPSAMIGTQTLALQHFADILGELGRVFSSKQLVDMTTTFVEGCSHVTGKLVGFRLCMILAIVKGPVFNDHTCRSGLAKHVFRWISVCVNAYTAVAKGVIFSRSSDADHIEHQQARLTRVQWLEHLRLSMTIISEVLDKARRLLGMAPSGLSSSSVSSPSLSTLSRPVSLATTHGDEEFLDESQTELMSITETALQMMPRLLDAYKDLQRLTEQAIQATGAVTDQTVATASASPLARTNSRHSLGLMRDRPSSMTLKQTASISTENEGGSGFTVLQALATSPTAPFPSVYPLQATPIKSNPAIAAMGHLSAMVTTGLMDITVVILELFHLTPKQQWVDFLCQMQEQGGTTAMAIFLRQVSQVCMAILFGDSLGKSDEASTKEDDRRSGSRKLPSHWLNLTVSAHHIVLDDILAPAVTVFELADLASPSTDISTTLETSEQYTVVQELWRMFFVSLLRVLSSPQLEMESLLPQSQRAVWKLAGNVKGAVGAKALLSLWRLTASRPAIQGETDSGHRTTDDEDDFISASGSPRVSSCVLDDDADADIFAAKIMISRLNDDQESEMTVVKPPPGPREISKLQIDLVPVVLRPLFAASLTLYDSVRQAAVSVIADILVIELQRCGDLSRVQNILMGAMDTLVMSENKGEEAILSRLILELDQALESRLHEQRMVLLMDVAKKAVRSIHKFFDLLLQIRSLPKDNDEFMDDRTSATLQLMQFIQVMDRQDMYVKYVHQLVAIHANNNNHVEAALTLQFHADILSWDPYEALPAIPEVGFSNQSAFARKEALYWKIIEYLEKGSAWELCIKFCKELAREYETTTYDYDKLCKVLQKEAQCVQDIITKERYFAEYFRVAYYGRGFPTSVRNKQFIYRGLEWEKTASFVERIQNQHPNAQLLTGKTAMVSVLSEDQLRALDHEIDGQYLQITAVIPEREPGVHPLLDNPLVPDNVKKYYKYNDVKRFSYSRPFDKTQQNTKTDNTNKPETDFLNLWTKKTILVCDEPFPAAVRRSRVISVEDVEISPIENAVLAIENKNQELSELNKKYAVYLLEPRQSTVAVNVSPFSMALNGAVDAPVNGGVALYRKAFLTDAYWEKNPDGRGWVRRLKTAIHDQVEIIDMCLETHKKLVSADMRPFHQNLVDFFKKNFKDEIEHLQRFRDKRRSAESDVTVETIPETPTLSRQSSSVSISPVLSMSPSLPMSPVFAKRRKSIDPHPPLPQPPVIPPSRAESLSRALKISLRRKKRAT